MIWFIGSFNIFKSIEFHYGIDQFKYIHVNLYFHPKFNDNSAINWSILSIFSISKSMKIQLKKINRRTHLFLIKMLSKNL
jgi:hypothetical protein